MRTNTINPLCQTGGMSVYQLRPEFRLEPLPRPIDAPWFIPAGSVAQYLDFTMPRTADRSQL